MLASSDRRYVIIVQYRRCAAGYNFSQFYFANNEWGAKEHQPPKLSRVLTLQAFRERWLAEAKPVCRTAHRG